MSGASEVISACEAERWLAMCDELSGQAARLRTLAVGGTAAEWQAIGAIESASRTLFGAFAAITRERNQP